MCAILAVHPAFNQGSQKCQGLCKRVGLHYITFGEPPTRYFQGKQLSQAEKFWDYLTIF